MHFAYRMFLESTIWIEFMNRERKLGAKAFFKHEKFLVAQPVLSLHEKPSEQTPFVTQAIYGHQAFLIEECGNGWAIIETEDGYRGYAQKSGLIEDNPRYRTSERLCRTCSIGALVYPIPSVEVPALFRFPYDARIELIEDLTANDERWLEVLLLDGRSAWIQRGDVEKPRVKSLEEVIALSYKFQELPYIWGGTSSEGYDCSGYVQMLFKQMGLILPRDSLPQSISTTTTPLNSPKKPGDLLFFGEENVIHVALYLGDKKFIHTGIRDQKPKLTITSLEKTNYPFLFARKVKPISFASSISTITDEIRNRMTHSWRDDNPVLLEDLRYLELNHWGFDGCVHRGELIVHKEIAEETVEIFQELFSHRYPIEKMLLIDAYLADDDLSCEDNNSSAFCSRPITGSTTEWSFHSFGLAIDINPLFNPYYNKSFRTEGIIGQEFLDRTIDSQAIIREGDPCYQAFVSRGWEWGGDWMQERGYIDYQHFYKLLDIPAVSQTVAIRGLQ